MKFITGWHSTNSMLPGATPIAELVVQEVRDEAPVGIDPHQLFQALKQALGDCR